MLPKKKKKKFNNCGCRINISSAVGNRNIEILSSGLKPQIGIIKYPNTNKYVLCRQHSDSNVLWT